MECVYIMIFVSVMMQAIYIVQAEIARIASSMDVCACVSVCE